MVNVLIVGHGAREHVIGETLVNNGAKLFAFMSFKNAGLDDLSQGRIKIHSETDFKEIADFSESNQIDFAVIGPEAPLVVGIVDALEKNGIPCVGPKIEAAQLEGSKVFMRDLLEKYNISSNVQSKQFKSMDGVNEYLDKVGEENVVVKPDGLTGGKGVKVYGDHLFSRKDILEYCKELINSKSSFLLEEKCNGEEFTLQSFCDGKKVVGTPIVQDHKRAFENDEGPNTGGMGSYSMKDHLMPFINKKDIANAIEDMSGNKLIEFNSRFGDPEAMNVLPLLKTNFIEICYGIMNENIKTQVQFEHKATVCKYLAPEGYPISPLKDEIIIINHKKLEELGVKYYYASVYRKNNSIFTTSSRAMGILGIANNLNDAEKIAEAGVHCIEGKLFHRKDIGTASLLQKRIDHMNSILNRESN
jgi:phosphoribosylamine--glycine ligase